MITVQSQLQGILLVVPKRLMQLVGIAADCGRPSFLECQRVWMKIPVAWLYEPRPFHQGQADIYCPHLFVPLICCMTTTI